jgi:undecaprenyl-diphosphatase
MRRRSPPPERHEPSKQSYPSGHALQTSAMALTTGYVLLREGLAPRWSLAPLGLASLAAGAGRLLLDRHWTSDVLGGYLAGVALGASCAGVYELQR